MELEMEVTNNVSDNGSASASDDDDQQDDELIKEAIREMDEKLQASPFDYSNHVQLIKLYRQVGDLDGARTARNKMASIFPLSEGLWLEWIQDELPLASVPNGLQEIQSLFDQAVEDYMSVNIWMEYCHFAIDKMTEMGGVDYVREVFEKALMSIGLHTAEGGLCWTMYREFEKTVFQSLQEMQANDDEDTELKQQVESQYDKIDKLFRRHLGVPVCGIADVFTEYQSFSDCNVITENTLPTHTRAVQRLKILLPLEEQLLSSEQSLESYKQYIDGLNKANEEPTLINIVYQRALAQHPLQIDLWTDYISFLDTDFAGVGPVLLKGHKQAVRNCPWVKDFWISLIQVQEKMGVAHDEIIETLNKSVGDNFTDSQSYLEMWMCYCDYLRRLTVNSEEGEINDLRRCFRRAREHLDTYFGKNGDPTDSLSIYQASLEARCYDNIEETRHLWTDVMKRHGKESEYWLKYAQLERVYGDLSLCRKILLMGVNSANDFPETICNELLQFEREQGTLDTYKQAVARCSSQLARIKERRDQAVGKDAQVHGEERKQQRKERRKIAKEATGKRKNQTVQSGNVTGKRKRQSHTAVFYDGVREKEGTVKKQKVDHTLDQSHHSDHAKSSTVAKSSTDNFVPASTKAEEMETESVPPPSDESKEEEHKEQERYNPLKWLAREDGNEADKKKVKRENSDSTIFVSNLAFTTTEEQLRDIFKNCGDISDVRLIKTRKSGSTNVFAYIEYTSIVPIEQALLLDRQVLNNRAMFVSRDRKKPQLKEFKPKYSDANTIFVTKIPFNVNEEQLSEIFQEVGEIKEVRLVRNAQGRSKGFAYIEYTEESSASTAVFKFDQYSLLDMKLNVAKSRPPKNPPVINKPFSSSRTNIQSNVEDVDQPVTTATSSFGGKQRISLVPRVLSRKGPSSSSDKGEEEMGIKKSNNDFRNLLLKKD